MPAPVPHDPVAPARPRIGLVLGSGGARGWCHIGVLRELETLGLRPDVVAGCSMGALVGAAWAAGHLDALEEFALSLTRARMLRLFDLRLSGGGLIAGAGIEALLRRIGLQGDITDLPLTFAAVATDLATGQEIWLRDGPLDQAIRASIALPGLIAPKRLGDSWLIDGGVVNPVPVSAARALGARIVLAVDPNTRAGEDFWRPAAPRRARLTGWLPGAATRAAAPPPPAMHTLLAGTIDLMTHQIRRSRLAGDPPEMLLGARLRDMSVLDFHRAAEAIAEGRRIARAHSGILTDWLR